MQEKLPDITCDDTEKRIKTAKEKPDADAQAETEAASPLSDREKILSIRSALNEIAEKEEEEEIRSRITENVKFVKDIKDNPQKYAVWDDMERSFVEKKREERRQARLQQEMLRQQRRMKGGVIIRKNDNPKEKFRKFIFWFSLLIFIGCMAMLVYELYSRYSTQQEYDSISNIYGGNHITAETDEDDSPADEYYDDYPEDEDFTEEATYTMLPGAANLLDLSPNVTGYIEIPDTVIQYPLMQNKDDSEGQEFFLGHDFYGNSSTPGSIYLDFRCNFDVVGDDGRLAKKNSDNLIVYGHNMGDGSMFGGLRKYAEDNDYYEKHPVIFINSNYEKYRFKIYGYFIADAVDKSDTRFEYWNFINFGSEDEFYGYVNEIKRRTLRNTDVDVAYGDRLLTLSTCSNIIPNGRLVVCARMMREDEDTFEGVRSSKKNTNIKWPTVHRDSSSYNPDDFVPYGG